MKHKHITHEDWTEWAKSYGLIEGKECPFWLIMGYMETERYLNELEIPRCYPDGEPHYLGVRVRLLCERLEAAEEKIRRIKIV